MHCTFHSSPSSRCGSSGRTPYVAMFPPRWDSVPLSCRVAFLSGMPSDCSDSYFSWLQLVFVSKSWILICSIITNSRFDRNPESWFLRSDELRIMISWHRNHTGDITTNVLATCAPDMQLIHVQLGCVWQLIVEFCEMLFLRSMDLGYLMMSIYHD